MRTERGRRTQLLLNALLFLRVCEDRNINRYEELLRSAQDDKLMDTFRSADRAFNAGLFDVLTSTTCSGSALTGVVREMYWPRSRFAFGVLRPDILAEVYQQYLAERVEVDNERATPGWVRQSPGAGRELSRPESRNGGSTASRRSAR